jgi:pyruvate formate lyase activating enzyme
MNVQGFQKVTLLDFPGKLACTVFCGGCNLRCPFCHNASLVETPLAEENGETDLFSYLEKRKGLLEGVCVTGGEPLLQPDLSQTLKKIRAMGFAVKLDTNGSLPQRLASILKDGLVDYVAMDVKSSPEGYDRATGTELGFAPFAESIRMLRESGVPHEFRTTAVRGIHREEDFRQIGEYLTGCERYFLQGFVDSGSVLGQNVSAFSPEEMKRFLSVLRQWIPSAALRGQSE